MIVDMLILWDSKYTDGWCRIYHFASLCSVGHAFYILGLITRTRHGCDICNIFIPPLSDSSMTYVKTSYRYRVWSIAFISLPRRGLWLVYNIIPYSQGSEFCTISIPLLDSSVTFIETLYWYPGMWYDFYTRTRRGSVTSVRLLYPWERTPTCSSFGTSITSPILYWYFVLTGYRFQQGRTRKHER